MCVSDSESMCVHGYAGMYVCSDVVLWYFRPGILCLHSFLKILDFNIFQYFFCFLLSFCCFLDSNYMYVRPLDIFCSSSVLFYLLFPDFFNACVTPVCYWRLLVASNNHQFSFHLPQPQRPPFPLCTPWSFLPSGVYEGVCFIGGTERAVAVSWCHCVVCFLLCSLHHLIKFLLCPILSAHFPRQYLVYSVQRNL